jgi:hypothetical protein
VPEALRRLNFIFFAEPARFEASANQLAEPLHTDGRVQQHTDMAKQRVAWRPAKPAAARALMPPKLRR